MIYISGGITGVKNFAAHFARAEKQLTEQGWDVVNPAKINTNLPPACTHEDYMKVSMAELSLCDTIYMLKGYEKSKGAMEELRYAAGNGYTIIKE